MWLECWSDSYHMPYPKIITVAPATICGNHGGKWEKTNDFFFISLYFDNKRI